MACFSGFCVCVVLPPGGRIRNDDYRDANQGSAATVQDQGTWLLLTLSYLEQQAVYEIYKPQIQPDGSRAPTAPKYSIQSVPDFDKTRTPLYMRCPTDNQPWDRWPATNYVGSIGPQCVLSHLSCGASPYQHLCERPEVGIPKSKDYGGAGNTPVEDKDANLMRGCFNRLGAKIGFRDVTDGLSQTILAGEVRAQEHDHMAVGGFEQRVTKLGDTSGHWSSFNGGAAHAGTLSPINYRTDVQTRTDDNFCGSATGDQLHSWQNWNLSWGFKSRHPGVAQFVFVDGSVHALSENIDHEFAYQFLGCRNDGQVIPAYTPD